jgi:hypothetical protein
MYSLCVWIGSRENCSRQICVYVHILPKSNLQLFTRAGKDVVETRVPTTTTNTAVMNLCFSEHFAQYKTGLLYCQSSGLI